MTVSLQPNNLVSNTHSSAPPQINMDLECACTSREFNRKNRQLRVAILIKLMDDNNPTKFLELIEGMTVFRELFPFNKIIGNDGDTLLHWIAKEGHTDLMNHLNNNKSTYPLGQFVLNPNDDGKLSLYYAMKRKDKSMARAIMSFDYFDGSDVDETNKINPLNYAIQLESLPLVKICVEAGCCLHTKDGAKPSRTPLDHAILKGNRDIIDYLKKKGAKTAEEVDEFYRERIAKRIRAREEELNSRQLNSSHLEHAEKKLKITATR